MSYQIELTSGGLEWRPPKPLKTAAGFWPNRPFDNVTNATKCAEEYRTRLRTHWKLRVVDENGVVWWESHAVGSAIQNTESANEEANMATPDLTKPMTFKRTVLIDLVQTTHDKEVAKRQEKEAERAKAREDVLAVIAEFTPDELYNIFASKWVVDLEALKFAKENKTWVTQEIKPTQTETDAEKFVRLLTQASDAEMEVMPNQNIYQLL